MMDLADKLRPHVRDIEASAKAGNKQATQIISLYEMHRRCPGDPGAPVLCEAAFDEWRATLASKGSNNVR